MPSRSTKCVRMRENPPPSMCAARGAHGWNRAPCGRIRGYNTHYCRNKGLWPPCGSIMVFMLPDWSKCVWMRAPGFPCHRECLPVVECTNTRDCHFLLQSWGVCPHRGRKHSHRIILGYYPRNILGAPLESPQLFLAAPVPFTASFVEYSASMAILTKFRHFIGKLGFFPPPGCSDSSSATKMPP